MRSTDETGGESFVESLTVRAAEAADAEAMADLYTAARVAAVPQMPPALHTNAEDRAWMAARLADGDHEAWVAEDAGALLGYALFTETWLDHLFIRPDRTGSGVGGVLLELVKSLRPRGFALWVFETNLGARRFYARHGLLELERTDGATNEEKAPDVRMAWPGEDPVAALRGWIDEVDDQLAPMLARRAALTAAVQQFKAVPGSRDLDRERELAERMAQQAPALGTARLERIMHTVITESLDAATEPGTPGPP
ncbi:GNAT family N-acetyltransferase [Nocardioides speluncae]|uniref:GNAT family N-acetyltransferase n=1 Tax=Nocardioides speluncae TaxID=2670337 RepID=UPI000D68B351|nr:GNAT family N-acetyltransferase [Nocardioides speluncae]